jgi:Fic family protein
MSLLSVLKQKLRIQVERKSELPAEVEPIHRPSFSIGDSLGDVKVGIMHLKTQLERIEASMLSKEYFEQSMENRDKNGLVIGKLDEALRILTDYRPSKPSLTEEAEDHVKAAIESLRLRQVLTVFDTRERTTPKQLASILGIKNNTATEHLRKLEKLGYVRRVSRGLYQKKT